MARKVPEQTPAATKPEIPSDMDGAGALVAQFVRDIPSGKTARARACLKSIALVLRRHLLPENWPNGQDKPPTEHLRAQFVYRLANHFDDLSAGRLPDMARDALAPGRLDASRDEKLCIAWAIGYVRAARSGVVSDNAHSKTVAEAFGVSKRAVQGWVSAAPAINADDYFPGLPIAQRASKFLDKMKKAGVRYQGIGRSAAAMTKRNAKRRRPGRS